VNMTRPPRTFLSGDTLKIWTNARATPNIIVLVHSTLYLSSIKKADLNKAVQMLSGGAAPEQVFGNYCRAIPLVSVTRAEFDERRNEFRFAHHTGVGHALDQFQLASKFEADELVAVLKQQLTECYTMSSMDFNVLRIWGLPLVVLFVHTVVCFLAWMLATPHDGVLHRSTEAERWLQDVPGEQGVLRFAVSVGSILVIWLLVRFLRRPSGLLFEKTST